MVNRRSHLSSAFGAVIRRLRVSAGISQEELAARAGLHRTYVSILERGKKSATLDVVAALAEVLGKAPHALVRAAERRAAVLGRE